MTTQTMTAPTRAASTQRMMTEPELERWLLDNMHALFQGREAYKRIQRQFFFSISMDPVVAEVCNQKRYEWYQENLPVAPDADLRLRVVAKVILSDVSRFDMRDWHVPVRDAQHQVCGTAHCIAGWTEVLGGEPAQTAIGMYGIPHEVLGAALLGPDAMLHFYDTNDQALEYLRGLED